MKKIFNNILVVVSIGLILASCDPNEFLEQENPNALTVESFWQNPADLNSGLNAVYNSFKNEQNLMIKEEYNRSDMNYPSYKRPLDKVYEYYFHVYTNASTLPKNKWAALYNGVFRANQVLQAYDRLKGGFTETEAEQAAIIVAQAKALRGWFYFSLHNTFAKGEIPLFDFVPKSKEEFQQAVSSSQVIMDFYRKDLTEAFEVLKDIDMDSYDQGRITAGACEAILGKSYLYSGDYAMAATYFKNVMDNYSYALTSDIGSNFTTRDEFNEESILEVNYTTDLKFEFDGVEGLTNGLAYQLGYGGWNGGYPASWMTVAYKNDPVDAADPVNIVTDEDGPRLRKYTLRTSYSVALVDDTEPTIGWYQGVRTAEVKAFGRTKPQYWRKHTNWEITDKESNLFPGVKGKSGINFRLIRLADVYLMYAECMLEGEGNVSEALMYINKVRKRSHVVLLGQKAGAEYDNAETTYDEEDWSDVDKVRQHLRHVERPLELAMEGNAIRTIDLRRWGVTKARFQELAARRYNISSISKNVNGVHPTRYKCIVTTNEVGDDDPASPNYEIKFVNNVTPIGVAKYADTQFNDLTVAAENYNDKYHSYLPIPLSEVNSNLNLYKTE